METPDGFNGLGEDLWGAFGVGSFTDRFSQHVYRIKESVGDVVVFMGHVSREGKDFFEEGFADFFGISGKEDFDLAEVS